jgi:hypothetical protein
MRDRKNIEELSGTISRGLLAGDVVLALDKFLHDGVLTEAELEAIKRGKSVLQSLEDPDIAPVRPSRARSVVSSKSVLDAIHAARVQSLGEPFHEFVQNSVAALDAAVRREVTEVQRPHLESVRGLFAYIAQLNLAHANDLTRTRRDLPKWPSRLSLSS